MFLHFWCKPQLVMDHQTHEIPNMNNAVLLKKFAGEEGEGVDVQKLFGYVGLFTLVALWWLGKDITMLSY